MAQLALLGGTSSCANWTLCRVSQKQAFGVHPDPPQQPVRLPQLGGGIGDGDDQGGVVLVAQVALHGVQGHPE